MLKLFNGVVLAIKGYALSFRIIKECRLGWVFLIPLLILILNIYLGGNIATHLTNISTDWMRDIIPFSMGDSWFADATRTLAASLVWIALFFALVYIGGFLLLILLSPLLVYVSERVDQLITGRSYPFVFREFLSDIGRGIRIALRNLFIEIANSAISFIVGFVPIIGFAIPIYLLGVASYFYGFSFMDYTLERRRYNVRQSIQMVRNNKGTAIGLGSVYMVFTMIPIIGFALAGFAAILSTVAATVATNELLAKQD